MATYASHSDVKRILQNSFDFDGTTTPTATEVESFIDEAEAIINQRTQNSWKNIIVADEFYNIPATGEYNHSIGIPIHLRHRNVKDFSVGDGDKLEVWDGSSYDDWLINRNEGRDKDFWVDNEQGTLFIRYPYAFHRKKAIRLTYRYGEASVPEDIRQATAMMATTMLIQSDDRSSMLNETGDSSRVNFSDRISNMEKRIDKILNNRTEISVI